MKRSLNATLTIAKLRKGHSLYNLYFGFSLWQKQFNHWNDYFHLLRQFSMQIISPWGSETLVCYTAVFSVVTQRSSPLSGEERCVTTLKTAV